MSTIRVATWNLRWARPESEAGSIINGKLRSIDPDVVVLTETRRGSLDPWPHVHLASGGRYRGTPEDGFKATIGSKTPIEVVDHGSDETLILRNFVAADVTTDAGPLRVIGLVIRWNQIPEYIEQLPALLERTVRPGATILAGDYNLRFPGGPRSRELLRVLEQFDLTIHTTGTHNSLGEERSLIDHIATTSNIEVGGLTVWPRKDPAYKDGTKEVTDHAGAALDISLQSIG